MLISLKGESAKAGAVDSRMSCFFLYNVLFLINM